MQRVLSILFGAGFTIASAWAAGAILLRRLKLDLDPLETVLFAFFSGAACLSLMVFALCLFHAVSPLVFLIAGSTFILSGAALPRRSAGFRPPKPGASRAGNPVKRLPGIQKPWLLLLFLTLTPFLIIYFLIALAPEVSPDGSGYHLGNVVRMLGAGGFVWDYHSMYSAFPQGLEMLFLMACALGAHSSAALVQLAFFVSLPLLLLCYGRRFQMVPASVFAATLVFASPVFGLTGSSAYNDAAVVTCSFAVFYLLNVFSDISSNKILIICGLLVGYCLALKYTGIVAALFAVTWFLLRHHRVPWLAFGAAAGVVSAPWLCRNWIWLGNPFAPLLNRWFPNSFFSLSFERSYLADIGHFEGLRHWWEFPLDLTLYGAHIPGFLGPVFLLAPFALLALRNPQGRRLLLAAVVFSLPIFFNAATRFLMPGMPFLALALGLALQNSPGVLPLLAVAQAVLCWPTVTPLYAADWSWRIREIPVRAAFRLEPEADFLRRRLPDYNLKPAIDQFVPPGAKIFSFSTRPEAYLGRTILVGYESAEGRRIQEALLQGKGVDELKRERIGFVLINDTDAVAANLKQNSSTLRLTPLSKSHETILYRVD